MSSSLPPTNLPVFLLFLLGNRKRLKVCGESMIPLLQPGDEILYKPDAYHKIPPQIDDIVVTYHPYHRQLAVVKRVQDIDSKGNCILIGDNPVASTDSRHWGAVSSQSLLGKVTNRFI